MPSVLPRSSTPANFFFSHLRAFIAASAAGRWRASASICAIASSATLMLLAPGAFITMMPRALAASRSTLSTPVPARAMTRSDGAAAITSRVTLRRAAHDERVGIGNSSQQFGQRTAGFRVDVPAFHFARARQQRKREIIGNDNFHRERLENVARSVIRRPARDKTVQV